MIFCVALPLLWLILMWRWLVLTGIETRAALCAAYVAGGSLVLVSTEIFTLLHQFNFIYVVLFWSYVLLGTIALLSRRTGSFQLTIPLPPLSIFESVLIGAAVLIAGLVGFIALYAPPNTWDSMTYHMARVNYWQKNEGVMNYPTNNIRQLAYFPYAEYAIAHLQILSGGDRFANMVQWSSMMVSAVGASLIAAMLKASRLVQIMTMVLVLTLPMGILQGSSTQNDHVVGSFVISTVIFTLKLFHEGRWRWMILAALSTALAFMTKGTGLLFVIPFIGMSSVFSGMNVRRKLIFMGIVMVTVMVLAGPFYCRLLGIEANPMAAMARGGDASMGRMGPVETVSNILRNTGTQLALPWMSWNNAVETGVGWCHQQLGISAVDPQTTVGPKYGLWYFLDEDYMPNPWHMMVILLGGVLFWCVREKERLVWFYALSLGFGAVLFCVTIKWQPWISRFVLPLFVLGIPLAAVVLARTMPRWVLAGVVMVALIASIHPLIMCNTRRLFSDRSFIKQTREQNYAVKNPAEYMVAVQVAQVMKQVGCREVGLKLGADDWDYSWQVYLGDQVRVEHVRVEGSAGAFAYPRGEFNPCAVIVAAGLDGPGTAVYNGRAFVQVAHSRNMVLYLDPLWARNFHRAPIMKK